jgi:hypothetical protein
MRLGRFVVTSVVVAATAVVLQPAHSAPFTGEYRFAFGGMSLNGADGALWTVSFEIVTPGAVGTGNVQRLAVDVERCTDTCETAAGWEQTITAANTIPDDLGIANLTAKAAGTTFRLHLIASPGSPTVPLTGTEPGFPAFRLTDGGPAVGRMRVAVGTISVGGLVCRIRPIDNPVATIGMFEAVNAFAQTEPSPPRSLPKGFLKGKHKVSCGY